MAEQIEALAAFVASTPPPDIPIQVRHQAKHVLLDTIGVVLAGSLRPEVTSARARLCAGGSADGATVFSAGPVRTDPRTAALLNGMAGRAIELCEGLRFASGQVAVQVLPSVLAVAEAVTPPGRRS